MHRLFSALIAFLLVIPLIPATGQEAGAAPLRVAVVDSESTYVNFAQQGWWTGRPPLVAGVLADQGYDVVIAKDVDLESRAFLDGVDIVYLALTRVLSVEASLNIQQWVADGGAVVGAFISPRMLNRPGCRWTSSTHPRDLADYQAYWTCPVPTYGHGGFEFWAREMKSAVWEWGPLSDVYQKIFINDPTPRTVSIVSDPSGAGHPILAATYAELGVTSLTFARPAGAGAEFSRLFNSNATSLLEFSIPPGTGSGEGVDVTPFDGYTAGQAIRYGKGRAVYLDFDITTSFPGSKHSGQTHGGVSEGDMSMALLRNAIAWATSPDGSTAVMNRSARTWGEITVTSSSISLRQYLVATGNLPTTGELHMRIFDPAGNLVHQASRADIAVYPGGPAVSYGHPVYSTSGLAAGEYRIEVDYVFGYPTDDIVYSEVAYVTKSQGSGITTVPLFEGDLPPRLAGNDRFSTAVAISKATFSPGVSTAFIATSANFPDALAGGAAAGASGPILLVTTTGVPAVTAAELTRLGPAKIVILGGTGAVSASVAAQLSAFTSGAVERIAGANRYSTAAAISRSTFAPGVPVVYLATGENYPDALAGGPVAALNGGPILLTSRDAVPSVIRQEIVRLAPSRIVILGGTGVISNAVADGLKDIAPVERLAGSDRYSTAEAISRSAFAPGVSAVYIATAENFPDALAGVPSAVVAGAPILLVRRDSIPAATLRELTRLEPLEIFVLGGTGVVSESVRVQLAGYVAGP